MADATNIRQGIRAQGAPASTAPVQPPPDRKITARLQDLRESMEQEQRKNRFVAFFTSRRFILLLGTATLVYLAVAIPHWMWDLKEDIPLNITIVDKTVPFYERREHRALYWLLIQSKFVKRGVSGVERFYNFKEDYIGSHPVSEDGKQRTVSLLHKESLADADIVYFADTYGVYSADYTQFKDEDTAATEHSPKMFGGMEEEEVAATEAFFARGGTCIGEFSTFASPTTPELRARMESIFGAKWTGWMGRYFTDFRDEKDVPKWLFDLYKQKYGKEWDVKGSGYMLCRDESTDFIILHDVIDGEGEVQRAGLEFVPLSAYKQRDVMSGVERATFSYWFDIMIPNPEGEVVAKYEWNVTPEGRRKLMEAGLDLEFPAVIRHQSPTSVAYYFAGEYVDFYRSMGPPDTMSTLYINRSFYGRPVAGSAEFFFWSTAYPLISNILRKDSNRRTGLPDDVYIFADDNTWFQSLFRANAP